MKKLKTSKDNRKARMYFVEYWADYVRTHPDKVWSKQQNILINSLFENAQNSRLTKEEYVKNHPSQMGGIFG